LTFKKPAELCSAGFFYGISAFSPLHLLVAEPQKAAAQPPLGFVLFFAVFCRFAAAPLSLSFDTVPYVPPKVFIFPAKITAL